MVVTYEDVIPSPIANATTQKRLYDGVHRQYVITPNEGYVLHDKASDWTEIDPVTQEETVKEAFFIGDCTCGATYDFTANPRDFYTKLASEVPADQIFGGVNNNHEIVKKNEEAVLGEGGLE